MKSLFNPTSLLLASNALCSQVTHAILDVNLPLHELRGSEVGCHGLIMLILCSKRVSISKPCRTEHAI